MSDQGQNPPAGWYPDPENPGQQRYWDGAQWAAPQASPTAITPVSPGSHTEVMPAGPPAAADPAAAGAPLLSDQAVTGGGGNGKVLAVIAIVVAALLVGGGAWALTRDSGGTDVLSPREFRSAVADICDDLDDRFDDFDEVLDDGDIDEIGPAAEALVRDLTSELRKIAPEGGEEEWKSVVDDARASASDGIASFDDLERVGRALDRIERRFDVACDDGAVEEPPAFDDDFGFDDFEFDDDFGFGDLDDLFGDVDFGDLEDFFDDFDFGDLEDMFGEFEDLFGDFDFEDFFGN